jgi:hypothetical protein
MSKTNERKIAGFFRQLKILCWKNSKLTFRNKLGFFAELFVSILMVGLFAALRFFVDTTLTQTLNPIITRSIIDQFIYPAGRQFVFFYPNTSFIEAIIVDSLNLVTKNNNRSGLIGIK